MKNLYGDFYLNRCEKSGVIKSNLTSKKAKLKLSSWGKLDLNERSILIYAISLSGEKLISDYNSVILLDLSSIGDDVISLLAITVAKYANVLIAEHFVETIAASVASDYTPNLNTANRILFERRLESPHSR